MAQVSGIEVRFSGDTSNLEKSVGRAQGAISNFAKGAAASLAAALSVGMFVSAGKAALQYADNIGKMAQKVGMTTEELSKLNYAAKLSDVSLSELQVGVQQLSKNMEAGSEGLEALGISATDASGNLRSTNEVMMEVAEAFAGMEDGAGKTAIAMNIFGRSGAQLIPMLNSGRRGLKDMGDEAASLNRVISEEAAKSAERFNDNMTRLTEAMDGLVKKIVDPVLPTLINLTEKFLELADTSTTLKDWFSGIYSWFEGLDPRIATTRKEVEMLAGVLERMGLIEGFADLKGDLGGVIAGDGQLKATREDLDAMLGGIDGGKAKPPRLPGSSDSKKDKGRQPDGFYHGEDPFFVERLQMIRDHFATEREILAEEYAMNQEVIRGALDNQLITEQEYHALSEKLAKDHQDTLNQIQSIGLQNNLAMASDFFGSMARIAELGGKKTTKIAKVFGIAQALISTFQGAAKALTLPFPANMAAYASVLAQGMSAVASIRKVNDNGGSNSIGKGSRGGAAASGGDGASGGGRGGGPTTTFSFTLMNDPMGFGEKFARQFIDQLNSTQRNGGQIRGVIA
jgi:hypothetical protein